MKNHINIAVLFVVLLSFRLANYLHNDYRTYYESINQAELRIVDKDFSGAFNIYKTIFTQYAKRHEKDLYNAALCAALIDSLTFTENSIKELIRKGYRLENFCSNTFKALPKRFWSRIEEEYDSLRNTYLMEFDSSSYSLLSGLREEEQEFLQYRKNRSDSLLFEHAKILHEFITTEGVPKVAMFNGNKLPPDVILHHFGLRNRLRNPQECDINVEKEPYASMNMANFDLEPLLLTAVFKGDITPGFFALCMSHSELDKIRQLGGFNVKIDFSRESITSVASKDCDTVKVNEYRRYLGMETLGEAMQKNIEVKYYYTQDIFPFGKHLSRFKEEGISLTAIDTVSSNRSFELSALYQNISMEIKSETLANNVLFEFMLGSAAYTREEVLPHH